jgi:hypothetical protein
MKAKEILLLILIIAAGILFYHAQMGKIDLLWDIDGHFLFNVDEFTFHETRVIEPPFATLLQILNSHGTVEIQGSEEEKITIHLEKRIWRKNKKQAQEVSEKLKMIVEKDESQLTLATNRSEFRRKYFETHFKVSIPQGMDITIKNSYGLVKTSRVGNAHIINSYGEIKAVDIDGELTIKNRYENVEVENVSANCQVDSRNSDISIYDIEGNVKIDHRYGKIRMENVSQNVEVEGYQSAVFGKNLKGEVNVVTSYRNIVLSDVGPAKITGSQARVEVDGATGPLQLTHKYGRVQLYNIQGDLNVDCRDTSVEGRVIVGEKIVISSSYRDIELAEFSGETFIALSNGDITLQPFPLTHPLKVEGRYSDIKFSWPHQEKFPFEARAKGGDIHWNLPQELTLQEENGFTVAKAFGEESEKPSIFLSTSYGTITIEGYPQ